MEWLSQYDGEPIKLIVTDPPYYLPYWSGGGGYIRDSKKEWIASMNVDTLSRGYSIREFADLVEKVQGGKINAYFFCNKLQIPEYFETYVTGKKCKFDILSWHKTNTLPTFNCKYLTDTEYILYFRNRGGCNPRSYDDAKTYFIGEINATDKKKWGHPTIKPISIVATLIRNSSEKGDLVCDPFMGSGTTRVAAYYEGRSFVGCELEDKWYELQEARYLEECKGITKVGNKEIKQLSLF